LRDAYFSALAPSRISWCHSIILPSMNSPCRALLLPQKMAPAITTTVIAAITIFSPMRAFVSSALAVMLDISSGISAIERYFPENIRYIFCPLLRLVCWFLILSWLDGPDVAEVVVGASLELLHPAVEETVLERWRRPLERAAASTGLHALTNMIIISKTW